jgi:transcriptional regulator with XRE-family HTH domain
MTRGTTLKTRGRRTPLFTLRQRYFLSLRDVERQTGIPAGRLSEYERGLSEPLVSTAITLARFFGRTVEELFR